MQLVVITSPTSTPHEAVLCNQMCHAGLRRLHLRKPGWKRADASSFLSELDDRTVRSVVLHDWHELVTEFSVKGLHYTEKSRPRPPLKPQHPWTISSAFHDLQQLYIDYGALDYALLSPIFNSISKEGYEAAFDLDQLTHSIANCSIPLVALGGITATNIPQVRQLGFSGAAVLGSVWSSKDPVATCEELLTACASA